MTPNLRTDSVNNAANQIGGASGTGKAAYGITPVIDPYFRDTDSGNDGDGDERLDSGNGAGGAAGTADGHADFVPG
jgi:hypothetical protein